MKSLRLQSCGSTLCMKSLLETEGLAYCGPKPVEQFAHEKSFQQTSPLLTAKSERETKATKAVGLIYL